MGPKVEYSPSYIPKKYERWLCTALLFLASSGAAVWTSRHSPSLGNHPPSSISQPENTYLLSDKKIDLSSVNGIPQPGEVWKVIIPDGQNSIELSVEIIEYTTVTYVRPEGKITLPSYCIAKNLQTGDTEVLDFDVNPKIKFVENIPN